MSGESNEVTVLGTLYRTHRIRVRGSVDEPMLCAVDLAAQISDKHYTRTLKSYDQERYVRELMVRDAQNQLRPMLYLTEAGAYKYLLQSKSKKAEAFQEYVYDLLKLERKRVVDSVALALKIAETEKAALRQETVTLQRDKTALELERAERQAADRAAELEAFEKRWGPSPEEARHMGLAPLLDGEDEDDWGIEASD